MIPYRIDFEYPIYLILMAALPVLVVMAWRRFAVLGPIRRLLAIAIRSIVWTALVMAIAGVQWVRTDDRLTVMYVLDQSESIPAGKRQAMLDYVVKNVAAHRDTVRNDRAGIVAFGRDAAIEIPPFDDNIPRLRRLESIGDRTDATNLESALNLAQASMPEDTARRIVIVTDGNENIGTASKLAARLAAAGIGIDVVPIRLGGGNEVLVEKVDLPTNIRKGQPFEARVVLNHYREDEAIGSESEPNTKSEPNTELTQDGDDANAEPEAVRGRLRLKQRVGGDESLLLEQTVTIQPGKNVFPVRHEIDQPAAYVYEAEFIPDDDSADALTQNNVATAYTYVRGQGRVLVIVDRDEPNAFDPMVEVLRNADIECVVQPSDQLFESLAELQAFDAVILAGVPRVSGDPTSGLVSMTDRQIEMLVQNTQQLGAGLMMIGGPESFGAGGWTGTKIEEAMPVDFKIKNDKVEAVGALALIMHASEMAEGNYWQKVIAKAAIEQLGPSDYAGVLHWTMNGDAWMWGGQNGMLPVGPNRRAMLARLNRMTPGDMPQFDPAMKMAAAGLNRTPASVKHCIIISDGDPTPPTPATLRAFKNAGSNDPTRPAITISTVAVASHGLTESRRLQQIATATGGKYYKVKDGRALPRIFQREARRVAKPLIQNIPNGAIPSVVFPHPVLEGIDRDLPPITGLVLTQTKDSSLPQVLIRSPEPKRPENSTVLAVWNYGLGRTAAWTTDYGGRWTASYPAWSQYDKFISQLVRWLMRPTGDTGKFNIATVNRDGEVQVVVNALDDDDEFLNFLDMNATVLGPDLKPIPLRMNQTAPGRYVGTFDADGSGNYFVNVIPGPGSPPLSTGVTVPYSEEYRVRTSNEALMQRLASVTPVGGSAGLLATELGTRVDPDLTATNAFRGGLAPARSIRDVWPWFVLAAIVLFVADIFVRRVSVPMGWLVRWIDSLRGRELAPATTARLDTLKAAKQRTEAESQRRRASVRFEPTPANDAAGSDPAASGTATSGTAASGTAASGMDGFDDAGGPTKKPSTGSPSPAEAKSYTERLLEAKRKSKR